MQAESENGKRKKYLTVTGHRNYSLTIYFHVVTSQPTLVMISHIAQLVEIIKRENFKLSRWHDN